MKRSDALIQTGRIVHKAIKDALRRTDAQIEWYSPQVTVIKAGGRTFSVTVREVPGR